MSTTYLYANSTYEHRYCDKANLRKNWLDLKRIASNIKCKILTVRDNATFHVNLFDDSNFLRAIAIKKIGKNEYVIYLNNIYRKKKGEN